MKISTREQKIIKILIQQENLSSSKIHEGLVNMKDDISLVTVKRTLADMVEKSLILQFGVSRSSSYQINILGRLFFDINASEYCAIEPDQRYGQKNFNFDLFSKIPDDIFTPEESNILETATLEYHKRSNHLSPVIGKKELERLVIELSWKSSKIEGNTYTLLDTEKLILENKEAPNHSHSETQMILNHKDAFNFICENSSFFKTLNRANIEKLHEILVHDLQVGKGLRYGMVGITGSIYQPLDNQHQIREQLDSLIDTINRIKNPYAKAMLALLGISYIQPFEDGNKRTGRLLANAILLAYGLAPLSYRSVVEEEYRSATLVFYELNSIISFKNIFIGQYDFAARNYSLSIGKEVSPAK